MCIRLHFCGLHKRIYFHPMFGNWQANDTWIRFTVYRRTGVSALTFITPVACKVKLLQFFIDNRWVRTEYIFSKCICWYCMAELKVNGIQCSSFVIECVLLGTLFLVTSHQFSFMMRIVSCKEYLWQNTNWEYCTCELPVHRRLNQNTWQLT